MKIFKAAADEVQQKTGNAVQFKIYPGGVMGDEKDMVRKLHIGQIHSAVLTSAGMSGIPRTWTCCRFPSCSTATRKWTTSSTRWNRP